MLKPVDVTEKWSFTERCEVWRKVLTGWWQARTGSCTQTQTHTQTHRDTLKDQIIMTHSPTHNTTTHQVWTSVCSLLFFLYQFHTVDTAKRVAGIKIGVWVECEDQYSNYFHIVPLTRWIRVCRVATVSKWEAKTCTACTVMSKKLQLNTCVSGNGNNKGLAHEGSTGLYE